jgi:peptidoglycan/xylan/chitin deacetylase (PgdA/CDA1 family)
MRIRLVFGALALVSLALVASGCRGSGSLSAPRATLDRTEPASVSKPAPSLYGKEWEKLPTSNRVVALTFDACGNDAGAASILSTLAEKKVTGTFFVCGRWVESFPAETKAIASRYPVGNHTYSHPDLTKLSDAAVTSQIEDGARVLRLETQVDARPLFRFPYGARDERTIGIVNDLGYGSIRWTVDTLGWKGESEGQSVETVQSRILAALQPGEIVLMHVGAANDGTTLDADALAGAIDAIRARGYAFTDVYRWAARVARIADDGTARFSAPSAWRTSSSSQEHYGSGYHYASPSVTGGAARFRLRIPQTAKYRLYGWWPVSTSANSAARISVAALDGSRVVVVDQRTGGGHWVSLGTFSLQAGDRWAVSVLRKSSAAGRIVADAFRITSITPP